MKEETEASTQEYPCLVRVTDGRGTKFETQVRLCAFSFHRSIQLSSHSSRSTPRICSNFMLHMAHCSRLPCLPSVNATRNERNSTRRRVRSARLGQPKP